MGFSAHEEKTVEHTRTPHARFTHLTMSSCLFFWSLELISIDGQEGMPLSMALSTDESGYLLSKKDRV